jgi:drug/metabolite transporter (DMT)-like permease
MPALISLAVLSFIWGYNWVVMKDAVRYSGPFIFTAMRSLLGGFALFFVILAMKRPISPGSFSGVLLLGLGQTTGFLGLATWALVSGGAGKTAVLVYTMPLWVLVLAWPILKESLQGLQWFVFSLTIIGLAFIIQPWMYHSGLMSTSLALTAGIIWALSSIWAKVLRKKIEIDLLSLTAWQMVLGSLPLFIIAFSFENRPIFWSSDYIFDLFYNVIPVTIGWALWLYALHELPAGIAGLGTLLTPVVGVLTSWLQLGEQPSPWDFVGMLFIFSGLLLLSLNQMGSTEDSKTCNFDSSNS